jgi:hypothetical protein
MDENEIMNNEEVIERAEEIVKTNSGMGLKVGIGVGATILVGGITYRFVVKPLIAKYKAKKNESMVIKGEINLGEDEDNSDCEE